MAKYGKQITTLPSARKPLPTGEARVNQKIPSGNQYIGAGVGEGLAILTEVAQKSQALRMRSLQDELAVEYKKSADSILQDYEENGINENIDTHAESAINQLNKLIEVDGSPGIDPQFDSELKNRKSEVAGHAIKLIKASQFSRTIARRIATSDAAINSAASLGNFKTAHQINEGLYKEGVIETADYNDRKSELIHDEFRAVVAGETARHGRSLHPDEIAALELFKLLTSKQQSDVMFPAIAADIQRKTGLSTRRLENDLKKITHESDANIKAWKERNADDLESLPPELAKVLIDNAAISIFNSRTNIIIDDYAVGDITEQEAKDYIAELGKSTGLNINQSLKRLDNETRRQARIYDEGISKEQNAEYQTLINKVISYQMDPSESRRQALLQEVDMWRKRRGLEKTGSQTSTLFRMLNNSNITTDLVKQNRINDLLENVKNKVKFETGLGTERFLKDLTGPEQRSFLSKAGALGYSDNPIYDVEAFAATFGMVPEVWIDDLVEELSAFSESDKIPPAEMATFVAKMDMLYRAGSISNNVKDSLGDKWHKINAISSKEIYGHKLSNEKKLEYWLSQKSIGQDENLGRSLIGYMDKRLTGGQFKSTPSTATGIRDKYWTESISPGWIEWISELWPTSLGGAPDRDNPLSVAEIQYKAAWDKYFIINLMNMSLLEDAETLDQIKRHPLFESEVRAAAEMANTQMGHFWKEDRGTGHPRLTLLSFDSRFGPKSSGFVPNKILEHAKREWTKDRNLYSVLLRNKATNYIVDATDYFSGRDPNEVIEAKEILLHLWGPKVLALAAGSHGEAKLNYDRQVDRRDPPSMPASSIREGRSDISQAPSAPKWVRGEDRRRITIYQIQNALGKELSRFFHITAEERGPSGFTRNQLTTVNDETWRLMIQAGLSPDRKMRMSDQFKRDWSSSKRLRLEEDDPPAASGLTSIIQDQSESMPENIEKKYVTAIMYRFGITEPDTNYRISVYLPKGTQWSVLRQTPVGPKQIYFHQGYEFKNYLNITAQDDPRYYQQHYADNLENAGL